MIEVQIGLYGRVSSEEQEENLTIESQLVWLRERIEKDGMKLVPDREFIDDGYSGKTLLRPEMERLRDDVAAGRLDRLYVLRPDRLARKFVHQVILIEEFRRAGVEIVFLNRAIASSPEDEMLLQMQGVFAEYQRAKLVEDCRRGRRRSAQRGEASSLSHAPYGYRLVGKEEGGGKSWFEVVPEKADVVREIFTWCGRDRLSLREISRKLMARGLPTPEGEKRWCPNTLCRILKNPAYKGQAAFGRTYWGEPRERLRPARGAPKYPRHVGSRYPVPEREWVYIPVPALVSEAAYEAVQGPLEENRQRDRGIKEQARYLLQGLLVCKQCGYAYRAQRSTQKSPRPGTRVYRYYRCIGNDRYRFDGEQQCQNRSVRVEEVEGAVWQEVCRLLENPGRLEQEYRRRLEKHEDTEGAELDRVEGQIAKVRRGVSRLIDGYTEGLVEKEEFEPRIKALRERLAQLEADAAQLKDEAAMHSQLTLIIGRLEEFASRVHQGLENADWQTQRDILRTLVSRIEVDEHDINVIFRISSVTGEPSSREKILQDRSGSFSDMSSTSVA